MEAAETKDRLHEDPLEPDVGDDDEPERKRARMGSLHAMAKKSVSWADLTEEEEADAAGNFGLDPHEAADSGPRRCDHCDRIFPSGNELHRHLSEARPELRANGPFKSGFTMSVVENSDRVSPRSGAIGPATNDDGSTGNFKIDDAMRHPQTETRKASRRKQRGSSYDICEMFSPPRIARWAKRQGLVGGWSLDLSSACPVTGRAWDCRKEEDRAWARRMLYRDRPNMLVLCPPCTLFSQLQNLAPGGLPPERCPEKWSEALMFLEFAIEMCRIQQRGGRGFLFEHPAAATSWEVEAVKNLLAEKGVMSSVFDMCRFGMSAQDQEGKGLVRKSTRIMTNIEELADVLSVRCTGGHRHVHLMSGRAAAAAMYPPQMCETVAKAVRMWLGRREDERNPRSREILEFSRPDLCDPDECKNVDDLGYYKDDLKGEVLDPRLARKARQEEIQVFRDRKVYDVVPRSSMPPGKRCIGVRWVETNKGSETEPKVRSRLVCQEFAFGGDPGGDLFAPTPPLGATHLLLSGVASRGRAGPGGHRAMLLDFKRAFLYGDVERELYIELAEEEPGRAGGQNVGRLRKAMYGTRDAPAVWQRLVRKVMTEMGFEASRTTPCVYWHKRRQLRVVAHVDDFLVTGPKDELLRVRAELKRNYEVDGDVLGPGRDEVRYAKFLGRIVHYHNWGIEIEADGRLVEGLLGEFDAGSTAEAETPGLKPEPESSGVAMAPGDASRFRRGAANLNYLSQDRADMAYASKEISRRMASPCAGDEALLTRAVRYLRRYPKWTARYEWQEAQSRLVAFTDSDWGGCVRTRRSTSGGVLMHGGHAVLHWSRTQQLVALSSAEAELNASIKAAQEALGLRQTALEVGLQCVGPIGCKGDSSANDGILKRTGSGKIKHLSVRQLWLQEQCGLGLAEHIKIPRAMNHADCLTHHFTRAEADVHFGAMNCSRMSSGDGQNVSSG